MIEVTDQVALDEAELQWSFVRASGPGGQHVNKAATAVQLRFDVGRSDSLPEDVRQRLLALAGGRMTEEGVLVIEANRYRSQTRNRQDALERLVTLIRRASVPPKPRRSTRPSPAARERRLAEKKYLSEKKNLRRPPAGLED